MTYQQKSRSRPSSNSYPKSFCFQLAYKFFLDVVGTAFGIIRESYFICKTFKSWEKNSDEGREEYQEGYYER